MYQEGPGGGARNFKLKGLRLGDRRKPCRMCFFKALRVSVMDIESRGVEVVVLHAVLCAALDCTGLAGMIRRPHAFVCVPFAAISGPR